MLNNRSKIFELQSGLLIWFKANQRRFPWRNKAMNDYRYIIAEILLQRTRAETIAKYYPTFILKYPNWTSIDNAELENVASFLKPIGLYKQRAVRLKKLAKEIVILKGKLPKRKSELGKLPFWGSILLIQLYFLYITSPLHFSM